MTETITTPTIDIGTDNLFGTPHNVILFNDESHSTVEVTTQIMKAIKCNTGKAAQIMMEAHTKGRAIVFSGSMEKCELVESILAEIRLGTTIE
jgi:ATP-dependent Clp protease adapter protein ClpS